MNKVNKKLIGWMFTSILDAIGPVITGILVLVILAAAIVGVAYPLGNLMAIMPFAHTIFNFEAGTFFSVSYLSIGILTEVALAFTALVFYFIYTVIKSIANLIDKIKKMKQYFIENANNE